MAERIPYVDGIRGYLIYSMTLSHLGVLGANALQPLSHKSLSVFFTGEGFMAISGLMMGYIMYRPVTEKGVITSVGNTLRRSWKILRYYIVVYVLCMAPLLIFDLAANETLTSFFRERDPATLQSFGLFLIGIYRPLMFDILYLYIILIGLSPLMIFCAVRFGSHWVLALSATLWLSVQYGLVAKVAVKLAAILGGDPTLLFGSFPIFAWQLPFVTGVLIGMDVARRFTDWPKILTWMRQTLMPWALASCLAFAVFRWITTLGLAGLGAEFFQSYLLLSSLTLLNFFAFCVVLACVLHSGPDEPSTLVRMTKRFLDLVLKNRVLRTIGSNSLLTFSASVILTYWLIVAQSWLAELGPPFAINALTFVGVIAALYLVVQLDRRVRRAFKWSKQPSSRAN